MEHEEDEIDIREVFGVLRKYLYLILLVTVLVVAISGVYAYFKPNIYQAAATVEVSPQKKAFAAEDMLAMATGGGSSNVDTELEIIKSRFVAALATAHVDMAHHYYTVKHYKKHELYTASPFRVEMTRGYGVEYRLYPIDASRYRLEANGARDKNGSSWDYDAVHHYGETVKTSHLHLKVTKLAKMEASQYRFSVTDPIKVPGATLKHLAVAQVSKKADIIKVSYQDNVPERAQKYVNALAAAYIRQSIKRKTDEASHKLNFIDKELDKISLSLNTSAMNLEKFKEHSNTIDLGAKAQSIITQMGEYEGKLAEISISLDLLNTLYKQVRSGKHLETLSLTGLTPDADKSSLALQIKELQDAMVKKKILKEDYTDAFPEVKKLTRKITQLKRIISSTIKNMRSSFKKKKTLIKSTIAQQQKLLNTLPKGERQFGQLQRTFNVNEKIYSYLLEQRSATAIVKASTVSKNRILDSALLPEKPIKPKRKLILVVGAILGMLLGVALAFLLNFLDDRVKNEEDITRETQVPVLATIPLFDDKKSFLPVLESPKSSVAESFRGLRVNLQYMSRDSASRVILFTSTISGEGKTSVAVNLGAILSLSGQKVIVLNMDLRKPTLHERLKISNARGMSTLLSGHAKLEEVIQHTKHEHFDAISSGPIPPNPSELIENGMMPEIVERLKQTYDVVILDTPPIGLVTDSRSLMELADTSIYVVRSNFSKKEYLNTVNKLAKEGIRGLGILLNGVKRGGKGGYGSYGGYGGYGYYEEGK